MTVKLYLFIVEDGELENITSIVIIIISDIEYNPELVSDRR